MRIRQMLLIGQHSERDRARGAGEVEDKVDLSFSLDSSTDRPWPSELTIHMKITHESIRGDEPPLFTADLLYAVDLDREKTDGDLTVEEFGLIWPFIRPDLINQMRWMDVPPIGLPLTFDIAPENTSK